MLYLLTRQGFPNAKKTSKTRFLFANISTWWKYKQNKGAKANLQLALLEKGKKTSFVYKTHKTVKIRFSYLSENKLKFITASDNLCLKN